MSALLPEYWPFSLHFWKTHQQQMWKAQEKQQQQWKKEAVGEGTGSGVDREQMYHHHPDLEEVFFF